VIEKQTLFTRICPGSHIALANLYMAATSILYLFDLLPVLDEHQRPIEPKAIFTSDSVGS